MAGNRFVRKSAEQSSQRRTRLAVILALVVLLTGMIWAVANREQIKADNNESILAHDLTLLWQWTDRLYGKGTSAAEWTIRWDLEGEASSLAKAEQRLQTDEKAHQQGTLSIFPLTTQNQAMVLYVTQSNVDKKQLLSFVNDAEKIFKELGMTYIGGMTVRGEAEYNNALKRLAQASGGKRIDRYKDSSGTVSESYYSEKLFSSIEAGAGKKANLQIAEHIETESGMLSLIVGIPLITGDYTVSGQEND